VTALALAVLFEPHGQRVRIGPPVFRGDLPSLARRPSVTSSSRLPYGSREERWSSFGRSAFGDSPTN
jgi:hypothetical protein